MGSERVRQSLRRQGLRPVYKRPYRVTTDSSHHLPVAPNILDRRFDGWPPNRAWAADLTYIATAQGWLYLAVIMDLASRRLVDIGADESRPGVPGAALGIRTVPAACWFDSA